MKQSPSSSMRRRGFTLIEVLVAVVIFALMSAAAYAAVDSLLRARSGLHARAADLRALQTTMSRLERDLRQALLRDVRGAYGDRLGMLRGDALNIELTRAGLANPLDSTRARSERVQWSLAEQQLNRLSFNVLDRAINSRPLITPMLDSVSRLEFRYFDGAEWRTQWPKPNATGNAVANLPRAVAVILSTRQYGEVRRVIELADAGGYSAAPGVSP